MLLAVNGAPAGAAGPAATITVDGVTCTLADAITAANTDAATGGCTAGSGADIIDLQTNVTLTVVNNTTSGYNGLPVVSSAITIQGNGNTISRQAGTPDFRIMFVGSGGNLTLNSATISGGVASGATPANRGGAINVFGALLTVTNSTLSGNTSTSYGGAIEARYSTVTVSNSTLSGNSGAVNGGGIFARASRVAVTDSVLSGNSAANGGGISVRSSTITVSNSTLSGNSGTFGGGIRALSASLAISNSTLSGNSAANSGGGVSVASSNVMVSDSALSGNSAATRAGGLYAYSASLTISNSTLSGNSAGASGGGIQVRNSPTILVSNSTLAGNSTISGGSSGGGIYNRDSTVTVSNSTLSGNSATFGGGIRNIVGPVTVLSSIIALQGGGSDCSGVVTTGGYSIESGTSCGFTGTGDQQNVPSASLALQPLAANGGPTQTRALGFGSVALDRIPVGALEANGCGVTVTTDQRGLPRAGGAGNGGSACDVGAYEAQTPPLVVTLASFDAQAMADRIQLTWETVSEANNAGFNLYRSASPDAPDALLAFVPSQAPGSTQGASYTFDDTQVAPGQTWYYWLEDVDLNGATSLHGPVSATLQAPTAVTVAALEAQAATPGVTPWGALVASLLAAAGALATRRRWRAP